MSQEDPFDWWAFLFALLAFGMAAWWFAQGGDLLIAAGFVLLALFGVGKWWWGK